MGCPGANWGLGELNSSPTLEIIHCVYASVCLCVVTDIVCTEKVKRPVFHLSSRSSPLPTTWMYITIKVESVQSRPAEFNSRQFDGHLSIDLQWMLMMMYTVSQKNVPLLFFQ